MKLSMTEAGIALNELSFSHQSLVLSLMNTVEVFPSCGILIIIIF